MLYYNTISHQYFNEVDIPLYISREEEGWVLANESQTLEYENFLITQGLKQYKIAASKQIATINYQYQTIFLSDSVKLIFPLLAVQDNDIVFNNFVKKTTQSKNTFFTGINEGLFSIEGKKYRMPMIHTVLMQEIMWLVQGTFDNNKSIYGNIKSSIENATTELEIDSIVNNYINYPAFDFKVNYQTILDKSTGEIYPYFVNQAKIIKNIDINLDALLDSTHARGPEELLADNYKQGEIDSFYTWYDQIQTSKQDGKYYILEEY